jgi:hypothetical protein
MTVAAPLPAREGRRAPEPTPTIAPNSCAVTYHDRLARLAAETGERLDLAVALVRTPVTVLPGRWLVTNAARNRQRDARGRIINGDQVCADQVERGGRVRCIAWEPLVRDLSPPDPDLPLPEADGAEEKLRDFYDEIVTSRGAGPEFQGNGRYTAGIDRMAKDLPIYMGQPPHPALCSGAVEMLGYLADQLAPLRKRTDAVYAAREEATKTAIDAVNQLVADAPATAVASTAGVPVAPPPQPLATPAEWTAHEPVGTRLSLALTRAVAAHVLVGEAAERAQRQWAPLPGIAFVQDSLRLSSATNAPSPLRLKARQTLRSIEHLAYAEFTAERYRELDEALFAPLEAARRTAAESCTCPE